MSRYKDDEGDPMTPEELEEWEGELVTAVASADGQRALRELLDALDSLPEKKLIAGAFCTLERERYAKLDDPEDGEGDTWAADEYGAGVCVLGSYAWYKALKPGMEQEEAFALLPTLPDEDYDAYESVIEGRKAGMPERIGWELTWINDERCSNDTDERRWARVRAWVQERIVQAAPA